MATSLPGRFGVGLVTLVALTLAWAPAAALAQEAEPLPVDELVAVDELLADPERHHGTVVLVEGELVGDYGFRSDGSVWTQLNDDSYAREPLVDGGPRTGGNVGIGVRMTRDLVDGLDPVGGYRLRGPVVQLTGEWRYHDPERSGESYLDVRAVVVVEPGKRLEEGPDWWVMVAGIVLVAGAGLLWMTRPRED